MQWMPEKILSCFIDESGDFGPYNVHSPYYFIAVVLHNQDDDIADKITGLQKNIELDKERRFKVWMR